MLQFNIISVHSAPLNERCTKVLFKDVHGVALITYKILHNSCALWIKIKQESKVTYFGVCECVYI